MRRYIESALRLKIRLIIAAALVFVVALGALSLVKQGLSSTATVWVEKPIVDNKTGITDPSNLNNYLSAATYMSGILDQLLGTYSFKLTIAQKAGIPIRTAAERDRVLTDLDRNLRVDQAGSNLMKVIYSGDTPDYAQPIISQTIQAFIAYQDASRVQQIDTSLQLYQQQLNDAQAQLTKSRDALNEYLQQHPGRGTNQSVADPTYTDLNSQYINNLTAVTDLKDTIGNLNVQKSAPSAVNTNFLRVIDQPTEPEPYKPGLKDWAKNIAVALALALITIVGLTLVATWTDQAVYTLNDLTSLALADAEGNARELLVGLIPFVPSLGAVRRRAAKESKGRRSQAPTRAGRGSPVVGATRPPGMMGTQATGDVAGQPEMTGAASRSVPSVTASAQRQ